MVIIMTTLLLSVFLFASAVPVSAQKATISFWVDENPARTPVWREVMDNFNAEHPDIKVNFRAIPDDAYDTVLRTAFTGGGNLLICSFRAGKECGFYGLSLISAIGWKNTNSGLSLAYGGQRLIL